MAGRDIRRSATLVLAAILAGSGTGQYALAQMYINGQGVPKDADLGLEWLRKAAAGDFFAKQDLALREKEAAPASPAPADFATIQQLAAQGDAEAQTKLGGIYADKNSALHDDAKAVEWFRKAAEQRNAKAEASLSDMYSDGKGVPVDMAQAKAWRSKAAEDGDGESQFFLSNLYHTGMFGTPRDNVQSLLWLR